jgi:type IV pilus assembly protein PilF
MRHPLGIVIFAAVLAGCQSNPVAEAPEHTPDRLAEINTQLGVEYMKEGQFETALKKLKKAIDIDPNYADAYSVLGLLYSRLGENDKAESTFKKAIALTPRESAILNNYGQFLCRQGRSDEAQDLFARALANPLYATPEVVHVNAAICALEQQKDPAAAEKFLRQALELNPQMSAALLQMARLSYQQERFLPARGYLQRFAEVSPHTAQSLWLGVQIEKRLGNRDGEASYAMTLKGKYPDSDEARQLLETAP